MVYLDLDVGMRRRDEPNAVSIAVRDFEGRERTMTRDVQGKSLSVDIAIPEPRSRYPMVEVEWKFDRSDCQTPYSCVSAKLLRMYSR